MVIEAPLVAAKAQAGQFVILRVTEDGERIPLTVADYDRNVGTVTIIFQTVGATTLALSRLAVGECLQDFVGPLGKKTETEGLKKVAEEYKIPCVDMYRTLGFNKFSSAYYFNSYDGTHPNSRGLKLMGSKIAGKLLSEY